LVSSAGELVIPGATAVAVTVNSAGGMVVTTPKALETTH